MKTYKLVIIPLLLCIIVVGCSAFEPKVNETGVAYTDMENYLKTTGGVLQAAGTFIPGYGTLLAGFGGLLSVIGGSITSVIMVKKRGSALDTVIKGVNEASDTYDKLKEVILLGIGNEVDDKGRIIISPQTYADIQTFLNKASEVKEIIRKVADLLGTESYLHSRVKSIG